MARSGRNRRSSMWVLPLTAACVGATVAWRWRCRARIGEANKRISGTPEIVILGCGFAGMNVVRELSMLLPDHAHGRITLVDQNNYLLFTPMLTEIAGGELDPRHVLAPPRQLTARTSFEKASVQRIDLRNRTVTLRLDPGGGARTLKADHLVIALGSITNHHGIPGLKEHSLSMKSLGDAAAIRNRVLGNLERSNLEQNADTRRAILTFVVAGGGSTGVETMAALNDLVRNAARHYPRISADEITTMLIEPGDRLLSEFSPDLARFAQRELQSHGVTILLHTKITGAGPDYVELEGGRRIPAWTLVWAAGVKPNPVVEALDCPHGRHGGIAVDEHCAIPGYPGVWALGDCAEVPKVGGKGTYAPTAQNATREGELVAANIVASLRGEKPQPFRFRPIGELALVGRHAGVASIYGQHFSGLPAWMMWRAIYLSKIPGNAQRARILLDWLLDSIFGRSIAELPLQ